MKLWPFLLIAVFVVFALMGFVVLLSGAVDPAMGQRALEQSGWKDVVITESGGTLWGLQGCGDDDSVYFVGTGKNPAGMEARGLVCCGLVLKACTVRIRP
jgi:hypothetical protein